MDRDQGGSRAAKRLSIIVGLIMVLLPFDELLSVWAASRFNHLDLFHVWKEILITVLAFPTVWLAWRHGLLKKTFLKSWLFLLIVAYVLLHLVLGFWALHDGQVDRTALIYALVINLRFFGFFLVCLLLSATSPLLRRYWHYILLIPAGGVVLFGLVQKFILPTDFLKHFGYSPKTIPTYQTVDSNIDYRRVQSSLRGANPLGAYLAFIIPGFVLGLARRRVAQVLVLTGSLIVLFYTYSRSAWVGLAISLVILGWLMLKKINGTWALTVVAVLAAGSVGVYSLRSNHTVQDVLLHTSVSSTSPQSSNAQRSSAIKNGLRDVVHQPLGRGPGTAGPASFRNNHPARIAEDYYLQIGQEVGVLGLAIFLTINAVVARRLLAQREELLAKILLASLAGICFINLVSHAWTDDTLSLLWWGLAGVSLGPVILADRRKQNGRLQKST